MVKKATAIVPTMLRMREELRKRLEREARKNERSLNAEMVGRLEQSFSFDEHSRRDRRDSAILDMFVDNDNVSSAALRLVADKIKKAPKSFSNAADLIASLNFSAYGKEIQERIESGEISDDQPQGDER